MKAGYTGAFVISWQQTQIDGVRASKHSDIIPGSTWRWTGEAVRVDGPSDVLVLSDAKGMAQLRKRVAQRVHHKIGQSFAQANSETQSISDQGAADYSLTLTDGNRSYLITAIVSAPGKPPLLLAVNSLPPRDTDLWVIQSNMPKIVNAQYVASQESGTICFVPGTRLLTPEGHVLVEDLQEGDEIQTKDGGAQPIRWIGKKRMTGARLYAMPHLRPVRIKAGAMGQGEPDGDLLVSPDHKVLLSGERAQALFNTSEVLVAARDLIDDRSVMHVHGLKEVTYIHLALDAHHIVWANGTETESFHPASSAPNAVAEDQLERLHDYFPDVAKDPFLYGDFARRSLSRSEAAILRTEMQFRH